MAETTKILVTGATGAIGSNLVPVLRERYGKNSVIAGYNRRPVVGIVAEGPSVRASLTDPESLRAAVKGVSTVYHLGALLSAAAERDKELARSINEGGLNLILKLARENKLKVFWASSIAVFGGPDLQRVNTPQNEPLNPESEYGSNKKNGEAALLQFFSDGGDARSVRFPGLLGPGPYGPGTTEVINAMIEAASKGRSFKSQLKPETILPMMDMRDAMRAAYMLMEAPVGNLTVHTSYNIAGYSISIGEVARNLQHRFSNFKISFKSDPQLQARADSWPDSINGSVARKDIGFQAEHDLDANIDYVLKHGIGS